jgi:predicted enzyme related to lactoylglutathione lyase
MGEAFGGVTASLGPPNTAGRGARSRDDAIPVTNTQADRLRRHRQEAHAQDDRLGERSFRRLAPSRCGKTPITSAASVRSRSAAPQREAQLAELAVKSARRVDRSERLEDRELECFGDACLVKPLETRFGRGVQQGEEDGQQPLLREVVVEAAVPTAALDEATDACADRLVGARRTSGASPARAAFSRAFDRPGYTEFRIGDYQHELGIIDRRYAPQGDAEAPGGAIVYWHVDDIEAAFERLLSLGAREHQPITPRGEAGFVTASAIDPFGNVLGIMYNPHYLDVLGRVSRG